MSPSHRGWTAFSASVCLPRYHSQAPKAVKAWRTELETQKRVRLASSIGDPSETPDLFVEGWEEALEKESGLAAHQGVNGAGAG